MSTHDQFFHATEEPTMTEQPHAHPAGGHQAAGHGGHSWMMIACCIPMIVIAVALVATGVASPGFLLVAVMCTAMMTLMMAGMGHAGHRQDRTEHDHSHAGHDRREP